jgi:endonuclease/exonuclease/phosphatase (EEP) superfamily protein YafD
MFQPRGSGPTATGPLPSRPLPSRPLRRRVADAAPALVLGVAALPSVVRLVGDHDLPWPIMVASFTPVAALGVAAATALAAALRRRRIAVAGLALLLLNAAWQAPLWAGDPPPREGVPVVAMTANVQYGWTDPASLVHDVRTRHVDLLGVVELTPESVTGLEAAGMGRLLPYRVLRPGPSAHGSGLWSRYPLTEAPAWDGVHAMPGATARIDGRDVVVRVVHPFRTSRYTAAAYRRDYRTLIDHLAALDPATPALVLGDFNASRDHAAFRRLLGGRWRDAPEVAGSGFVGTWSPRSWIPALMQLDHILISRQFGVRSDHVVRLPGSDHRALVADLVLRPPNG